MKTSLDTNILSSLWLNEPSGPAIVTAIGAAKQVGTLLVSPPVYAESLAHPYYSEAEVIRFFAEADILIDFSMSQSVWIEAGRRYGQHAARKRSLPAQGPRRILADFIIGAHALLQADCLMTLDSAFYRRHFPELTLYPIGESFPE